MPWVRIDENAMDHPKIGALPDGAFRLWVQGLAYCQKHLTDGFITDAAIRSLLAFSPKRREQLEAAGLWDRTDSGICVHDYLAWNDSKQQVIEAREQARVRMALVRDPEMRKAIQARDQGRCRYCGQPVNWLDRKSGKGATYDHVIPGGGDHIDNLVTACRSCNSRKGRRSPQAAGMVLLTPEPRFNPNTNLDKSSTNTTPLHLTAQTKERSERVNAPSVERSEGMAETRESRAGAFCSWYEDTHQRLFGVGYMGTGRDYQKAIELVEKFTDQELRDGALVWFGMDDDFATSGTRTIPKFASRITGCLQTAKLRGIA